MTGDERESKSYEIYLIEAVGFWYIGSTTIGAQERFHQHLSRRLAPLLGSKITELGEEAFSITIVDSGVGNPIKAEQKWYDHYLSNDFRETLNSRRPGGWPNPPTGYHHTPEAITKIKEARFRQAPNRLGIKHTEETKAKMSIAHQDHLVSAETRDKISAAHLGRIVSPETRAKISINQQGRIFSPETRAKISASVKAARRAL